MTGKIHDLLTQKLKLLQDEQTCTDQLKTISPLDDRARFSLEAKKANLIAQIDGVALELKRAEIGQAQDAIRAAEEEEERIIKSKIGLAEEIAKVYETRAAEPDTPALRLKTVELALDASRKEINLKQTQVATLRLRIDAATGDEGKRVKGLLDGEQDELGKLVEIGVLLQELRAVTIATDDPSTPPDRIIALKAERQKVGEAVEKLQTAVNELNQAEIKNRSQG